MTFGLPAFLLTLAIASEIVATSALKASEGMTRLGPSALVVAGYAAAFLLLAHTLKTMPVGVVYAIWSGVGIVGVALVGAMLFGEAVTAPKLAGMGLIVAGVALLKVNAA
ncbi:small multidrug resistance pump [Limimonas halophila]|uniref:Small multidrug resistance pump n=1 Tax=Limimonas halophila TaxID=1082479 RepID=A0A1G7RKM6_9PROT|nr:small multidrug resistance pump [Limimonas halophila]